MKSLNEAKALPGKMSAVALVRALTGKENSKLERIVSDEVAPVSRMRGHPLYPTRRAIQLLWRSRSGQTSVDRRNHAQAEKAEVETSILRDGWVPLEQVVAIVSAVVAACNEIGDQQWFPQDKKELYVDAITAAATRRLDSLVVGRGSGDTPADGAAEDSAA